MVTTIDVLQFVLDHEGERTERLEEIWKQRFTDDLSESLEQYRLTELSERTNFYWCLQTLIEKELYHHPVYDNRDLGEIVATSWNEKNVRLPINADLVVHFLYTINLKFTNKQKAFRALCRGDLNGYKMLEKDPSLFIDCLIRFLNCLFLRKEFVLSLSGFIIRKLFPEAHGRSLVDESIKRLNFLRNDQQVNFAKMSVYKRVIGVNELIFAPGLAEIISENITIDELSERKDSLALVEFLKKYQNDKHVQQIELSSNYHEESSYELADSSVNKANESEEKLETEQNEQPVSSFVDFVASKLQNVKASIIEQYELELAKAKVSIDRDYVTSLEEESRRLRKQIEQHDEKVKLAVEKAMTEFIQKIAGKEADYLLSDLFEETEGKLPENRDISVGRLINLFSMLSMYGIEPHSNYYNIGDTFTVSKDDLAREYMVSGPIETNSSAIRVKLIRYGWTLNGKVIVQPLVEEIKGE